MTRPRLRGTASRASEQLGQIAAAPSRYETVCDHSVNKSEFRSSGLGFHTGTVGRLCSSRVLRPATRARLPIKDGPGLV